MTRLAVRLGILALLSLVLPLAGPGPALGDIVVQYTFPAASGGPNLCPPTCPPNRTVTPCECPNPFGATTVDCGVTATDISIPDTVPDSGEAWVEDPPTGAPGPCPPAGTLYGFQVLRFDPGANSTTPADAVANGRYFTFTVKADCGYTINLDSLTFSAARGGAGTPRGFAVRSDVDCYASDIFTADVPTVRTTLTPFSIDLSGSQYQGLTEITFRIYGYSPGGGLSVEYSNVTVNGTVVPCMP